MSVMLPQGAYFGQRVRSNQVAGLLLTEKVHPHGETTPPHAHSYPYFCLVIAGDWDEGYEGGRRLCSPHTVIYHPAGEVHWDRFTLNRGRVFAIELGQQWLERVGSDARVLQEPRVFSVGMVPWAALRICDESRRLDSASALLIEGLMLEVLGTLERARHDRAPHPAARWLADVEQMLREQYRAPPSVAQLAQTVGVHPIHLARALRARWGYSAAEYVARVRVEHACRLMTCTRASLAEIAVEVGFYDQSHLTRAFRRIMGATPARYRATVGHVNHCA